LPAALAKDGRGRPEPRQRSQRCAAGRAAVRKSDEPRWFAVSARVTSSYGGPMRDIAAERRDIERAMEGQTLCSRFAATVARLGDAEALVDKGPNGERRALSWNEYREQVRAVALGLQVLGVAPKQFGVFLSRNRPEYL